MGCGPGPGVTHFPWGNERCVSGLQLELENVVSGGTGQPDRRVRVLRAGVESRLMLVGLQQGHAQAGSGRVLACPGGFGAVSRSLLMLTPGDATSPLKRQRQLDGNCKPQIEIVVTTSTSVLESDRTTEALKGGILDDIRRSHHSAWQVSTAVRGRASAVPLFVSACSSRS